LFSIDWTQRGLDVDEKSSLTERQKLVLDYIGSSIEQRGYPPTLREIGQHLGIRSTNGVNDHLKALEKKGFLKREDLKSRALRPIYPRPQNGAMPGAQVLAEAPSDSMVDVPVLGRVAAGQPILAVEQAEDTVRVDRFFLGANREVFALRVKGDSMIEAGIFDGDFIFVRKQMLASRGDIVVAMIEGEATVKYYHPEGDEIWFKPANRHMKPIVVRREEMKSIDLLGVVVGVYRKMT
jgi:repressor LexA